MFDSVIVIRDLAAVCKTRQAALSVQYWSWSISQYITLLQEQRPTLPHCLSLSYFHLITEFTATSPLQSDERQDCNDVSKKL